MSDEYGGTWAGHVPPASFEEYPRRYAAFFKMRRENGILELRLRTDDGPYVSPAGLLGSGAAGRLAPGKLADVVLIAGELSDLDGLRDRDRQVWLDGARIR